MSVEIFTSEPGDFAARVTQPMAGKPSMPEGAVIVNHPSGTFAYVAPVAPPNDDPWASGPPNAEELAALASAHGDASGRLNNLQTELAALPQLRYEALVNGDPKALRKVEDRTVELKAGVAMATVASAKARLALAFARKAQALAARDAASAEAHRLSSGNGYPEGRGKAEEAESAYGNAGADLSMASSEVAAAKQALAMALLALEV